MATLPRERILVIEDSPDIRAALAGMLSSHYDVDVAEDGTAGLAAARRLKPSLVISDFTMPGLTGIEVLKAIRADPAIAYTPVIILTAHGELQLKLEGFGSGADDYLHKPCNSRELLARIRALLENRALQRELARKNDALERALAGLREAQERLLDGERLKTALKMAGALAHEINNPLSGLLGYCELVRLTLGAGHPAFTDVCKIEDQARRIADVVRRIQALREVKFVTYVGADTIMDLGGPPGVQKPPGAPK